MDNLELNNNFISSLLEVYIVKDGVKFQVIPFSGKDITPLESLHFTESIRNTEMGGIAMIKDLYQWSEQLNVHSFEKIGLKYLTKKPTNQDTFEVKTIEFNIFAVAQVTNRPLDLQMVDTSIYTILRFDFTTEELFTKEIDGQFFPQGKDFVGFIATGQNSTIPGLINNIFNKLNIENYEIEPTYNGIWVKSNEISYPWAKSKGQISISNLLQYICNFAVSKTNPNAVNYFLWRDRDGYNFKSAEKMIKDQENDELEEIFFTKNIGTANNVRDIQQMHEPNILKLSNNNVFQSFYEKISPNYEDFYLDFVDSSLSFKRTIVDVDYHRDIELWRTVEKYKIVPESQKTSVFLEKVGTRNKNGKTPIESLRTDDIIYGYYDNKRLNTPFPQEWEYLGKTSDSRWNDVNFIPQYDITDLDINIFYTIHKKIREPLNEKRRRYSYLKNIKRKWEVYRCSVCCLADRLGGIKDQAEIDALQALPNPSQNPDFLILFGPTGIFADSNIDYKIAAAGSFSDVYNYDTSIPVNRGLTLSYNFSDPNYNQNIQQFYNFAGANSDQFENYKKHIFTNGFKTYDLMIERSQKVIAMIDELLGSVDGYISSAESFLTSTLQPYPYDRSPVLFNEEDVNQSAVPPLGHPSGSSEIASNFEFDVNDKICDSGVPGYARQCSKLKYLLDDIVSRPCLPQAQIIPRYRNRNGSAGSTFVPYSFYLNCTEGLNFTPVDQEYQEIINEVNQAIDQGRYVCNTCLDPVKLEVCKRIAIRHKKTEENKIKLFQYIKNTLIEKFNEKWQSSLNEYLQRKAFFISKKESKIDNNSLNVLSSNLSLLNVKSITRKPVRNSRYEILARNNGITGGNVGPYLYKVFFDDNADFVPGDAPGNHPYYDQLYDKFYSLPKLPQKLIINDILTMNDPSWQSQYGPVNFENNGKYPSGLQLDLNSVYQLQTTNPAFTIDGSYSNYFRKLSATQNIENFETRYNIFDLQFKKPPNLKREELSSYVRIEFKQPIGLESIVDFPDGFIRNAGYEYFLPYIVSLTAGPNGRQTINQNVVVIGMDPYGFDVAMKRIKDPEPNGKHYWWNSGIESAGMDLQPEIAFETVFNYYADHIPDTRMSVNEEQDYGLDAGYFSNFEQRIKNYSSLPYNSYTPYCIKQDIVLDNSRRYYSGYGFFDTTKNNKITHSKYDAFLRNTEYASNYIFDSHKVKKVHRNWWAFHIPDNLFIIPSFKDVFGSVEHSTSILNTYGYDNASAREHVFFENNQVFDYLYSKNVNFQREDKSLKLNGFSVELSQLLDTFSTDPGKIQFYYSSDHQYEQITGFKDQNDELFAAHPTLQRYFRNITSWWLTGDHVIYRPGLVTEDVWKYDISGYTNYGVVQPPVHGNHPDIFDSNFAAQFVVFARTSENFCLRNKLRCLNPKGSVFTSGCPADNPYCNCPAQNRKPKEPEPSYIELYKLEQELKECSLIEQHLGPDWLGCVWSNPENTASCNCPEIGDKFMKYLEYTRTYATFWNTPSKTPLLRNMQLQLLFSQTLQIVIPRNESMKIGKLVTVEDFLEFTNDKYRRFGGKWMITEITNIFYANKDFMSITLNRDSFNKDPEKVQEPVFN